MSTRNPAYVRMPVSWSFAGVVVAGVAVDVTAGVLDVHSPTVVIPIGDAAFFLALFLTRALYRFWRRLAGGG